MKELFDEDAEVGGIQVNRKYAAAFDKRKQKIEMMKAMEISDDDESDSEIEDSDAELLTDNVEMKIFETLQKIKDKNPEIYTPDTTFFTDADFAESATISRDTSTTTYRDHVRTTLLAEGADAFNTEEFRRPTPKEEAEAARNAFRATVADSDDDGDILVAKPKSAEQLKREAWEDQQPRKKQSVIESFWSDNAENLDDDEKFLKDFLTNQRWKERASIQGGNDDSEDEVEKADEFERRYNFRFEEEGADVVVGHARGIAEDSVRNKDDKRKRKRLEVKERKEEEKKAKEEELKRLKNLKKQEISRRLKLISEVTGSAITGSGIDTSKMTNLLDTEFDPEQHDHHMQEILGDDYYDQEEDQHPVHDQEACDEEAVADEDCEWFLCDACQEPIQPGKRMFECTICPDFVICGGCERRSEPHPHKLKRSRVPDEAQPPSDWGKEKAQEKDALDELFAMDFEDVIADGIATRFKYRSVKANDFGLSADDILTKPDTYLNKKASFKKLAPYRGGVQ